MENMGNDADFEDEGSEGGDEDPEILDIADEN
jgi:hypothetical protein